MLDRGERQGPVRAAYGAAVLAAASGTVSLYWATGGTALLDTVGGRLEELARGGGPVPTALALGVAVLKFVGAAQALALVRPWGERVPSRLLRASAWAAGALLTFYGALMVGAGGLALTGLFGTVHPTQLSPLRWHVLFWDPWFLLWGLCLLVAVRGQRGRSR